MTSLEAGMTSISLPYVQIPLSKNCEQSHGTEKCSPDKRCRSERCCTALGVLSKPQKLARNYKMLPFEFSKIVENMEGKLEKGYLSVELIVQSVN